MVCFFIFLVLLPHLSCFSFPPLILYLPVRTFHLILAPSFSLLNHMASHCWWCTVLWCMDFGGSFVWCHRAIDSGGGGRRGGGTRRGEAGRGAVARPPPTACWEKELKPGAELEGGTEGHNTLFSPLNPSGTCHTLVMDGERKTLKKERGRK